MLCRISMCWHKIWNNPGLLHLCVQSFLSNVNYWISSSACPRKRTTVSHTYQDSRLHTEMWHSGAHHASAEGLHLLPGNFLGLLKNEFWCHWWVKFFMFSVLCYYHSWPLPLGCSSGHQAHSANWQPQEGFWVKKKLMVWGHIGSI